MYPVTFSLTCVTSLLGGVLPPVGREDLQDPKGAGGKEEDTTPEAGHDAGTTWHSLSRPPSGAAQHGTAAHGSWATSKYANILFNLPSTLLYVHRHK